jgi:hypothetical protein
MVLALRRHAWITTSVVFAATLHNSTRIYVAVAMTKYCLEWSGLNVRFQSAPIVSCDSFLVTRLRVSVINTVNA